MILALIPETSDMKKALMSNHLYPHPCSIFCPWIAAFDLPLPLQPCTPRLYRLRTIEFCSFTTGYRRFIWMGSLFLLFSWRNQSTTPLSCPIIEVVTLVNPFHLKLVPNLGHLTSATANTPTTPFIWSWCLLNQSLRIGLERLSPLVWRGFHANLGLDFEAGPSDTGLLAMPEELALAKRGLS